MQYSYLSLLALVASSSLAQNIRTDPGKLGPPLEIVHLFSMFAIFPVNVISVHVIGDIVVYHAFASSSKRLFERLYLLYSMA